MIHRVLSHARQNLVAYLALMVAVASGGGGYAVAATTHATKTHKQKPTTVVACASQKSGAMYLHTRGKHCVPGRHKVTWAIKGPKGSTGSTGRTGKTGAAGATGATGPQGPAGPSAAAFGTVGPTAPRALSGMTATRQNVGSWLITITNPACANPNAHNVLTVSPTNDFAGTLPTGAVPVASTTDSDSGLQFSVYTGYLANGTFTQADDRVQIIVECGATLVPGQ